MRVILARTWLVVAHALAVILIGLALHTPPVREGIRAAAADRATRDAGVPVSIGHLQYNLLTLVFEADDVAVAPPPESAAPRVLARRVDVDLSWIGLLSGRPVVQHVRVSGLDVEASPGQGVTVDLRGLSLAMEQSRTRGLEGRVRLQGPAWIHVGTAVAALTGLSAAVAFDGRSIALDEMRLTAGGLDAVLTGSVDPFAAVPRASIRGNWRGSVPELCSAWAPDAPRATVQVPGCDRLREGTLQGRLTLEGALSSPVLHVESTGEGLVDDERQPAALLRLDVAMPLPRPAAGPPARWYLSLGQAF